MFPPLTMRPTLRPANRSGWVKMAANAVAADGSCWLSSFVGGGISRFSSEGHPTFHAPARFGDLNHPMGIAFDQDGNLWIVNLGEPGDFSSPGSVTVYPNGDPKRAVSTSLSIAKPFAVQIDGERVEADTAVADIKPGSVLRSGRRRYIRLM